MRDERMQRYGFWLWSAQPFPDARAWAITVEVPRSDLPSWSAAWQPRPTASANPPPRAGDWAAVPDVIVETGGTDWLTAVATLLAVVVGGGVTFWVQHVLNRRRQKGEAKAAARVVQGDLGMATSRIKDMVVDDHRWFGFDDLRLTHWAEQQGTLALELSAEDWEVVSQSALELRWFSEGMARALGPAGPHEGKPFLPLDDKDMTSMRKGWENATKAYNVLAPLAETKRETGLLHEQLEPVGKGEAG